MSCTCSCRSSTSSCAALSFHLRRMGASNAKIQALHAAVMEDNAGDVRDILEQNGLDPNARGENEFNALHIAILQGALKSMQVLLDSQRVDMSSLTSDGQTPLLLAAAKQQEDIALYLLEISTDDQLQLHAEDRKGMSVIHYASACGMQRLLETLLQRGVSPVARTGKLRHTPLMLAAQGCHLDAMKILLEAGVGVTEADIARMTALHHACLANAEDCVELLVKIPGVAVDTKDISGCTPLLYCVNNKNQHLEQLLVKHGASLITALDAGFSELCYHTLTNS